MRLTETTPFTLSPAAYLRQVTRNTEGLLIGGRDWAYPVARAGDKPHPPSIYRPRQTHSAAPSITARA